MKTRRLALVVLLAIFAVSAVVMGCTQEDSPSATPVPIPTIQVSLLIHVSEDDVRWFRDFEVAKGTNAYELTEQATEGELESTSASRLRVDSAWETAPRSSMARPVQ